MDAFAGRAARRAPAVARLARDGPAPPRRPAGGRARGVRQRRHARGADRPWPACRRQLSRWCRMRCTRRIHRPPIAWPTREPRTTARAPATTGQICCTSAARFRASGSTCCSRSSPRSGNAFPVRACCAWVARFRGIRSQQATRLGVADRIVTAAVRRSPRAGRRVSPGRARPAAVGTGGLRAAGRRGPGVRHAGHRQRHTRASRGWRHAARSTAVSPISTRGRRPSRPCCEERESDGRAWAARRDGALAHARRFTLAAHARGMTNVYRAVLPEAFEWPLARVGAR